MANNTIYIKKTAVAGRAPTTSNIGQGELAVNMTDQKLFSTNGSVVFEIGANLTSSMVGNSTANVTSNTTMLRIANSTASANLTPGSLTIGTSTVNSTVIQATTLAANGNVTLGTQANKATVTYTTNAARTYTMPDAGADASFVMTEGTQTINGAKSFTQNVSINSGSTGALTLNRSADNQFVGTTYATAGTTRWIQYVANNSTADMIFQSRDASGAVLGASLVLRNATRNADFVGNISIYGGAGGTYASTITSAPLAAFRTYTLPDAGADASFVMSEGTQTINGAKTFSNANLSGPLNNTGVNNRDKLRVWSSSSYTIGMSTPFTFGAIDNDYAMTFQMNNASTRGFWWGDAGHANSQGAMALSTDGKLTVATALRVGYGESDTTIPSITTTLDLSGNVRVTGAYYDSTNSTGTAGQVLTTTGTSTYWAAVGAATNLILTGSVTEDIFAITDGASVNLDPTNGSIQTWTLGATRTPGQANWSAGQGITLMVDDGSAYSITWTTLGVVWKSDGGVAPTLNTTGYTVIALWKVGTTIYGARVGNA